MSEDGRGGRIVVGVDDSPGGRAALAHALREGKLRVARVEVLGAFTRPEFWAGEAIPGWSMGPGDGGPGLGFGPGTRGPIPCLGGGALNHPGAYEYPFSDPFVVLGPLRGHSCADNGSSPGGSCHVGASSSPSPRASDRSGTVQVTWVPPSAPAPTE